MEASRKTSLKSSNYDACIIGASPMLCLYAIQLSKLGKRVALIERQGEIGGVWQGVEFDNSYFYDNAAHVVDPHPGIYELFEKNDIEMEDITEECLVCFKDPLYKKYLYPYNYYWMHLLVNGVNFQQAKKFERENRPIEEVRDYFIRSKNSMSIRELRDIHGTPTIKYFKKGSNAFRSKLKDMLINSEIDIYIDSEVSYLFVDNLENRCVLGNGEIVYFDKCYCGQHSFPEEGLFFNDKQITAETHNTWSNCYLIRLNSAPVLKFSYVLMSGFENILLMSNPKNDLNENELSRKYISVRMNTNRPRKSVQEDIRDIEMDLKNSIFYGDDIKIEKYEQILEKRKCISIKDGDQISILTDGNVKVLDTASFGLGRSIYDYII